MCAGPCIRVECAYLDLDLGGPVWGTSVWGKLFCWCGQQVGGGSFTEGGGHHWPAGARPIAWSSGTSFIDRQAREVTNDGCSPPPPAPHILFAGGAGGRDAHKHGRRNGDSLVGDFMWHKSNGGNVAVRGCGRNLNSASVPLVACAPLCLEGAWSRKRILARRPGHEARPAGGHPPPNPPIGTNWILIGGGVDETRDMLDGNIPVDG